MGNKSFSRLVRELMSILNGIIFGLQGESFRSFSTDYFLFICLFSYLNYYFAFLAGIAIDLLARYISPQFFIQLFEFYYFRTSPAMFLLCARVFY